MAIVSLVRCENYEEKQLRGTLEKSLSNIGFSGSQFHGARVAVKPNLLTVANDDSGVITHPEFFRAVVRLVKSNGGIPVLVESPAVHSLERVIKKTGYSRVVEEEAVSVADPGAVRPLHFEGAKRFKHISIGKAYFDADMILALPKFKTHGITYITGAVKLLFGAVPGMEKSKMHLRLPCHTDFAEYLLDLYGAMTFGFDPPKPVLHIMDAVWALEGEGPGLAGRPRQMKAVLAGTDAVALDWAAAQLAGLDTEQAPTIAHGFHRGYGATCPADIQIKGEALKNLQITDFVPATGDSLFAKTNQWPLNTRTFKNLFVERPIPRPDLCTLCYQCRRICPAEAIRPAEKGNLVPSYDYGKCIRCYCCLEICPEGAIKKRPGRLQWMLDWISR